MAVVVEQNVLRLDVAVDDAALVSMLEGIADLAEPVDRLRRVDDTSLHGVTQRPALDILHDDVETMRVHRTGLASIEDTR